MKKFLSKYFPAIPVTIILAVMIFSHSCANTTNAPSGGPKDSIPPVITRIKPAPGVVGVPVRGAYFDFTFDEYIKVKDPKNIFLSPPSDKAPKYKMRGKTLRVYFESDLDSNTTYTLNFTDAIQDNNEGNMFPGFSYVFSTGESVDSMYITGSVQDCNTLLPTKGATVMLYKDLADSAIFLKRPDAAVKTDDWGFFSIRNIQDTSYRLYAIMDSDNNNVYDPSNDLIAFVDSVIRPVSVVNDTIFELQPLDVKDTVNCLARKPQFELNLFKEKNSRQMIKNSGRSSDRAGFISFSAPKAHIDSMWISGISDDRLITQFNAQRDSLELWVNDTRQMPDTLHLFVNYRKTDTAGVRVPAVEHVKLFVEGVGNKRRSRQRQEIEHSDTVLAVKLNAEPTTIETQGFTVEFGYPIVSQDFKSLKYYALNPKQQEVAQTFTLEPDTTNVKIYRVHPNETLLTGYDYYLKIPERSFRDINGFYNDSTEVKVALPTDEKLSTLTLNLSAVNNKYIIELQDEKRSSVINTYVIDSDRTISIKYLKSASYCIRITEDINRNSMVDSGDLLAHIPPEKVKYYKINDSFLIKIPESTEIIQDINISELFKN